MKWSLIQNSKQWKDSASIAFAILAAIETFWAVSNFSLDNIMPNQKWWVLLLLIIGAYVVMVIMAYFIITWIITKGIKIEINGITIRIQEGDLFKADGWKVIPFNEYFDTIVDDKIIAHNSLNGVLIDSHIDDLEEFRHELATNDNSPLAAQKQFTLYNRYKYPLGCIKTYQEYMLLALTHFNEQNMAHISKVDYEHCLMSMWKEISRIYANKPINLPLLGSGITRFDDVPHKSHFDLLKCMLCTLKASSENINQPITILLTKEAMQGINIYEVKGMK
jgi:hypothetical protein